MAVGDVQELGFGDEETKDLADKALKVGSAMDHFEVCTTTIPDTLID